MTNSSGGGRKHRVKNMLSCTALIFVQLLWFGLIAATLGKVPSPDDFVVVAEEQGKSTNVVHTDVRGE